MYGVLRFGAINCDQEGDICSKERIKDTPIVRIYPTLPVPAFDHEVFVLQTFLQVDKL